MCTAIRFGASVGRNLDVYKGYGEEVIITPREYSIALRCEENIANHYAMIGIGTVSRGFPLYFDAVNEHGLYMAGLNYVGNAHYLKMREDKRSLAPFELIPYILGVCRTVEDAERELSKINLIDLPFSRELPNAELHWIVADKERAITVEPDADGLNIYNNPIGVLTNNPSFPYHILRLGDYATLSPDRPANRIVPELRLNFYSEGMGAIGLPGDLSSSSRFIRATFHTSHHRGGGVTDLFHLLASVEMPDGSVKVGDLYERTEYTAVADLITSDYYYRTYDGAGIVTLRLSSENLDTPLLIRHPMLRTSPVIQN